MRNEEVNLRFYVRRTEAGKVKRGVIFIREIVPRQAIAWVARTVYNENYVALPMRHRIDIHEGAVTAEYAWQFGDNWYRIAVKGSGAPERPLAGTTLVAQS